MRVSVRILLKDAFEDFKEEHGDTLESIYGDMEKTFPNELKIKYREATESWHMAREMRQAAEQYHLDKLYEDVWGKLPTDARRKLSQDYKRVWRTESGVELRKHLIRVAASANISKLYYYAAHGMYDQLAEELGLEPSEVPHNFAEASRLVAEVKALKKRYRDTYGKEALSL